MLSATDPGSHEGDVSSAEDQCPRANFAFGLRVRCENERILANRTTHKSIIEGEVSANGGLAEQQVCS